MSRGVKDLRELICVSRLTIQDSDEDDELTFSDDDGRTSRAVVQELNLSALPFNQTTANTRTGSAHSTNSQGSLDSGIDTTPSSSSTPPEASITQPNPPSSPACHSSRSSARKRRQRKQQKKCFSDSSLGNYDIPKPEPLPPVLKSKTLEKQSLSSLATGEVKRSQTGNYDSMMAFCDHEALHEWLREANVFRDQLTAWCQAEDNFVCFANFWLTDFSKAQRAEIFHVEFSIVLEQLEEIFISGRNSNALSRNDVEGLAGSVLREYPATLLSPKGAYVFLDYLDVLSSLYRLDAYRKLLSNVKCSTRNREYAQSILAIRAFTLLSLWSAVVNFYRKLHPNKTSLQCLPSGHVSVSGVRNSRAFQATRLGYKEVLRYMITCRGVSAGITDKQHRSLLLTAVTHGQKDIVSMLLNEFYDGVNVNEPADNGNTALHAAANNNEVSCLEALIVTPGIDINAQNQQCDNATPLHLAVMHGHVQAARLLVTAGANPDLTMGEFTAHQLAKDFDRSEILAILDTV